MRISLILFISLFCSKALFAEKDELVTDEYLAEQASMAAEMIKRYIGEDWAVSAKDNVVTIESKFDVYHVAMMSRPTSPPPMDAGPEILKKETRPEKYVIQLRYEKPLSKEELIRRRDERQKHADVLNFGAKSKQEWSDALRAYLDGNVPRYRAAWCQVYRKIPDSLGTQAFPLDSLRKVGAAKELLDSMLGRLRGGHD